MQAGQSGEIERPEMLCGAAASRSLAASGRIILAPSEIAAANSQEPVNIEVSMVWSFPSWDGPPDATRTEPCKTRGLSDSRSEPCFQHSESRQYSDSVSRLQPQLAQLDRSGADHPGAAADCAECPVVTQRPPSKTEDRDAMMAGQAVR